MDATGAQARGADRRGDAPAVDVRVSDVERQRVAAQLIDAHGEGRLSLAEFDERVRAAHGAVVRADLESLTADLPAPVGGRPAEAVRSTDRQRVRSGSAPALGTPPLSPRHPMSAARSMPLPPMPFGGPCGARGLRGAVVTWAVVSLINLAIWVAVVAGTGTLVHPWWIWVAGPWGLALLLGAGARQAARSVAAPSPGPLPGR